MYTRFSATFPLTPPEQRVGEVWEQPKLVAVDGYQEFAQRYAGATFSNGLYRFHDAVSGPAALKLMLGVFPDYATTSVPFGFDWLGRQFAIDTSRVAGGQPLVLIFEPGAGESFEVPANFHDFHEGVIVGDMMDAALATNVFAQWAPAHAAQLPLGFDVCVGYRIPLYLGGEDDISNLEVSDLDVYWSFCGQLINQTRDIPTGTQITGIEIS